jgi:hypothetical protein
LRKRATAIARIDPTNRHRAAGLVAGVLAVRFAAPWRAPLIGISSTVGGLCSTHRMTIIPLLFSLLV